MGRIIKFRGKREDDRKWVYGDLTHVQRIVDQGTRPQVRVAGYNVDEATTGQFTGLHDKNGVEIYEGDVVSEMSNYVIVYSESKASFQCVTTSLYGKPRQSTREWTMYDRVASECFEVVGNVHDNPDYLQ